MTVWVWIAFLEVLTIFFEIGNLQSIDLDPEVGFEAAMEEQEVTIISGAGIRQNVTTKSLQASNSSFSQPYRFGGRVGLFGHYLRSLKIILLLTCIKLDAMSCWKKTPNIEQILKGICDLASGIEAVERKYVKKGQRLLFCGPDLISLGSKCVELQLAFDALNGTFLYFNRIVTT